MTLLDMFVQLNMLIPDTNGLQTKWQVYQFFVLFSFPLVFLESNQ